MNTFVLQEALASYFQRQAVEHAVYERVKPSLALGVRLLERDCFPDHLTASTWIVDGSRQEVLLLFHRKLRRWLQPGGHPDGDPDLVRVALREAREETGLTSLCLLSPNIFDFEVQFIPARSDMPAHNHLDVRFLLQADRAEPIIESLESAGARWIPLSGVERLCNDQGMTRMVAKTLFRS